MGKNVFVIDDDADFRKLLEMRLKGGGCTVTSFGKGSDVLTALSTPPDVFLIDYTLPDISGVELAKKIRENSAAASLPIIFLTGKDEVDLTGLPSKDRIELMTKPCDFDDLLTKINTL